MRRFKAILFFVLLITAAAFAVDRSMHPKIYRVTHNAVGKTLVPGDVVTVTLRGEPGGAARFDITSIVTNVPMQETSPGVYQGTYTIPPLSVEHIPFASVTGYLQLNGSETKLVAIKPVMMADSANTITPFWEISPAPGMLVTTPRPVVQVQLQDPILLSTAHLQVDGSDITKQAQITYNSLTWAPAADLRAGVHHVSFSAIDRSTGQPLHREWDFNIRM